MDMYVCMYVFMYVCLYASIRQDDRLCVWRDPERPQYNNEHDETKWEHE